MTTRRIDRLARTARIADLRHRVSLAKIDEAKALDALKAARASLGKHVADFAPFDAAVEAYAAAVKVTHSLECELTAETACPF